MITKKTQQAIDKELARMELRKIFAKQDRPTVYTVLRHVSQSGMSRDISLLIVEDGRLRNITYLAGKALGDKMKDRNGQWVIRVNGCGMDMGFHLVYSLSSVTYAHDKERAGYILHHEWA
jgi:hypothetical protein